MTTSEVLTAGATGGPAGTNVRSAAAAVPAVPGAAAAYPGVPGAAASVRRLPDTPFVVPTAWAADSADSAASATSATSPGITDSAGSVEPTEYAEVAVDLTDLAAGLAALAAAADVPPATVAFAGHLAVLRRLTNDAEVRTDLRRGASADGGRVTVPVPVPGYAAVTWRRLVTRVRAEELAAAPPGLDATGNPDDVRARPVHALFEAVSAPASPPSGTPAGYGLHVVATAERLHLRTASVTIAAGHTRRLAALYRSVFAAMAADPDGDAAAALLPADERNDVLTRWAAGPVADRGATTVLDLIRAQAAATPDAVAVRTDTGRLTFRELIERANQLAHHLLDLGAQPDTLIGVCLGRTLDLVPTLLAVWSAGAGYLPLDPELPADRLRHMVEATGCPIVVTSGDRRATVGGLYHGPYHGRLVLVDDEWPAIGARPRSAPAVPVTPAQLAYVIYTSGSTGRPKGVLVQHRGLVNYLLWTVDAYTGGGRWPGGAPVFSSISFDLGIPNIFTPLITGQPVHLLPDPFDLNELGDHLAEGAPYSFIKLTPGHLDLLTYQLSEDEIAGLAGMVIAAGDSFSADLAQRWLGLAGPGGTRVGTEYGPTEITIGNSGQPITARPATELVPLGVPIPNTTMYVLTDRLEPVPVGVPGEVYIGGVGVARGYLGSPGLTAQRFLPDPYGPPGSRLYRSGDLARWLPDGTLEFLGRIDHQVKIRGYRVELGEIGAVLREHPWIRDAVVVVREPQPGNRKLVAYLVLAPGHRLDTGGLRTHLAATLPEYMIPAAFVAIDRIPLTTNGKVDSRALPAVL